MSTTSNVSTSIDAGTYRIDPGTSKIDFTTRHMFGTGKVTGSFSEVTGEIVAVDDVVGSTVVATAPARSFDTGHAKRDEKVLSAQLLDGERHPHLEFRSTAVEQTPDGWILRGQLTVAGGVAPLDLLITGLTPTLTGVDISATGSVDRYAHGVTAMKGMIARRLDVSLAVSASRV